MNDTFDEPAFLQKTFLWNEAGYGFAQPPEIDLLAPGTLQSPNPWLRLAATLESAKTGAFDPVGRLYDVIDATSSGGLAGACFTLIGDACPAAGVARLEHYMAPHQYPYVRLKACSAATQAGYLWLSMLVIRVWETIALRDRPGISLYLSHLLEEDYAEIASPEGFDHAEDYVARVERRIADLESRYGLEAVLFKGLPSDMDRLTRIMLDVLDSNVSVDGMGYEFFELRHRFEAQTGVDCARFYRGDRFQPAAARQIIEDFVDAGSLRDFAPGRRYFFRRPVV